VIYIEHFNEQSFDWLTWRSGSIVDILKIPQREQTIITNKQIIRKFAIGYCDASNIPCRPKKDCIAVMFNTGEVYNWWTHLTKKEFISCFQELENQFLHIVN
jgi:hypothetical protein